MGKAAERAAVRELTKWELIKEEFAAALNSKLQHTCLQVSFLNRSHQQKRVVESLFPITIAWSSGYGRIFRWSIWKNKEAVPPSFLVLPSTPTGPGLQPIKKATQRKVCANKSLLGARPTAQSPVPNEVGNHGISIAVREGYHHEGFCQPSVEVVPRPSIHDASIFGWHIKQQRNNDSNFLSSNDSDTVLVTSTRKIMHFSTSAKTSLVWCTRAWLIISLWHALIRWFQEQCLPTDRNRSKP